MSSQTFLYVCDNMITIINNIQNIIILKDSICDLYNIDYISKSPLQCSNGFYIVQIHAKNPCKKSVGYQLPSNYVILSSYNHININMNK